MTIRITPIFLAAIGILVSAPTVYAQQRVTNPGYGISYVVPKGYRSSPLPPSDDLFGETIIDLDTKEGILSQTVENTSSYTSISILSSIRLHLLPIEKTIRLPDDKDPKIRFSEAASRRLIDSLQPIFRAIKVSLDYQSSAPVKVDGEDAVAIRCNSFVEDSDTEYTVRFVLMPRKEKLYLFLFAAKNTDFEEEVKPFYTFMSSFKFLKPPGIQPAPKPAPKKPTKKKG